MRKERPQEISLSMAGHCRMELWCVDKKMEPEPHSAAVLRNFDYGDVIESLLFETITITTSDGPEEVGGWLSWAEPIKDWATGFEFDPTKLVITDRQRTVAIIGADGRRKIIGHIDGIGLFPDGKRRLVDSKSANGFSFLKTYTSDLAAESEVFSRELVIQQQEYLHALREEGETDLEEAVLIYLSKEKATLMCRVIPYDPALVGEGLERMTAGLQENPPEPDWNWNTGEQIPLRCGYCDHKHNCGKLRGYTLEQKKIKPNTPQEGHVWIAKKLTRPRLVT